LQKYRSHTNEVTMGVLSIFFVCLGLLLIYSTSSVFSMQQYGSQYHFFYRQFLYACFGLALMAILGFSDYRRFQPYAAPVLVVSGLLLALVFLPGLGKEVRGAQRWIDLGPVNFQPSELVKVTMVFYLASLLSRKAVQKSIRDSFPSYLRIWLITLPFLGHARHPRHDRLSPLVPGRRTGPAFGTHGVGGDSRGGSPLPGQPPLAEAHLLLGSMG
jgi:cell division protein FtsW (lipid II flippase)